MQFLESGGAPKESHVHQLRERLIGLRVKKSTGYQYYKKDWLLGSVFKCWNMQERKRPEDFTMLQIGEDIEYPIGFKKYFEDIEYGGIER